MGVYLLARDRSGTHSQAERDEDAPVSCACAAPSPNGNWRSLCETLPLRGYVEAERNDARRRENTLSAREAPMAGRAPEAWPKTAKTGEWLRGRNRSEPH